MAASLDRIDRRVIPRWRPFGVTVALGELNSASSNAPGPGAERAHDPWLERLAEDWRAHRSLSFAADLIGGAIVRGDLETARSAAEFVDAQGDAAPDGLQRLAALVLGREKPGAVDVDPEHIGETELGRAIAAARARLRIEPNDPMRLVDVARGYTLLGQPTPALRAMRLALALAPNNRFVLRSASRFFLHQKDMARAYDLLRNSAVTPSDPWLVASEIAVASATDRKPRFAREGRGILSSQAGSPFDLSELASALGTLELTSGNTRQARKLFRTALQLPTDNALAQAQWASENRVGLTLSPADLERPRTFEARAQELKRQRKWAQALTEAKRWLYDEPFSRHAAAFASYLASVPLERFQDAAELAQIGLNAAPRDPLLLNNLAFSLAQDGKTREAEEAFRKIPASEFGGYVFPTLLATQGLLAYRRGDPSRGRDLYRRAIAETTRQQDEFRTVMALLNFAREELTSGQPQAEATVKEATERTAKAVRDHNAPELEVLRDRLFHDPHPS